jgi:hypothetical protein
MNDLKSKLVSAGFDVPELKTLREVAMLGHDRLAIRAPQTPESGLEKQFPIYVMETPLDTTMVSWERLDSLRAELGFSSILLGDQYSVARLWEMQKYRKAPQMYLDTAKTCSATEWFDKEWQRRSDRFSRIGIHSAWDDTLSLTTFDITRALDIRNDDVQYIGFFPTLDNWEIPAYLPFGCWNECPCPEIQVCIHQYWHQQYQSRIVALTHDTVICHVKNPPTTREDALALAQQQMLYCSDIVFQGTETIERLAATLLNNTYWDFWWD